MKVAIKVLDKEQLRDNLENILAEIATLNTLDHPNIVKYYETYNDEKKIFLVMEYVTGEPLYEKISNAENQAFTEKQVAGYIISLLHAINHCHALDICHRDVKPDNIMIMSDDTVKLIDFGMAAVSHAKELTETAGTPFYMAPEVIKHQYGKQSDIWSIGIILYTLVSGYFPFQGEDIEDLFRKICAGEYHFEQESFSKVSKECKDLI